jgi:hypothetical protein
MSRATISDMRRLSLEEPFIFGGSPGPGGEGPQVFLKRMLKGNCWNFASFLQSGGDGRDRGLSAVSWADGG